ncbi:MAG: OmpH family outer membrane protein [Alphaproteobacteria bacterium]
MKLPLIRLLAIAALGSATLVALPSGGVAQNVPQPQIAILDQQRILRESSAAIDIKDQIERQRRIYQDAMTKREQELRSVDQELTRQRTILAPEAFAQKRREFETQVAEVQRELQTRKRELDQAYGYGVKQIQRELNGIIVELAKERGFNLVLGRRQVIFANNAMDISGEVLKRLNQRLPNVTVPLAQK